MYSFIYKIYFFLQRKRKKYREKEKNTDSVFQKVIQFILGYIEAYYNIFVVNMWKKYPSEKYGLNRKQRKEKIVVSLTSFPGRIDTLWISIESILRQTVKPDKIILWLAESQFDGLESLPDSLLILQKRGLTIRFCDDLLSHKKYFYTMQEYPDDLVVLLDDDMIYPIDTIKKLLYMHKKYPRDICVISGEVMSKNTLPSQWRNPYLKEKFEHSNMLQAYTGSGSLFPPHVLSPKVFDKEAIKQLCPYADDLWLAYMANCYTTKTTALYPWRTFPISIYNTAEECLWKLNGLERKNDMQWNQILQKYEGENGNL